MTTYLTGTDYVVLVLTDDFYRINAPRGFSPEMLLDRRTGFKDNINTLYMRNPFAGRSEYFDSAVAIKKGVTV
jgi:hypothetical protein